MLECLFGVGFACLGVGIGIMVLIDSVQERISRLAEALVLLGFVLLAIAFLVAILSTKAMAHDPDTGEPNWITHGGYTGRDGVHCCGPRDCERLDKDHIKATPLGFMLHDFNDEIVPYAEATPSEDGHYWRCHSTPLPPDYVTKRRCFFAPVGTE